MTDFNELTYPVYPKRQKCGVVGCDALAYDYQADGRNWYNDHPRCSPVFLCKFHYDHYWNFKFIFFLLTSKISVLKVKNKKMVKKMNRNIKSLVIKKVKRQTTHECPNGQKCSGVIREATMYLIKQPRSSPFYKDEPFYWEAQLDRRFDGKILNSDVISIGTPELAFKVFDDFLNENTCTCN